MKPMALLNIFLFFLLICLSDQSLSTITSSTSMNYKYVDGGLVPTSRMTPLGSVFHGSVIRCAAECNRLSTQCNSFTFQPSTSCRQATFAVIGICQLMYFAIQDEVVLGPSTGCQSFYVAEWCDAGNPCMNSGKCDMTRWPDFCQCPPGYGGTYCETAFDYIDASNTSYKPIFEPMFWGDATIRCQQLDRSAHLVILRSLNEYEQLVSYLSSSSIASQSSKCYDSNFPTTWSGFWVAKRRLNVYAADQATCSASPFVWVKFNYTAGLLSEQAWESTMWTSGNPMCSVNYPFPGMIETCCSLVVANSYAMNDISCYYPMCPICQLDTK